jgi:sulfite reductase (NADPH) flavoprotein alpha-component
LSGDSASNVTISQTHDNFVQGGTVRTDIRNSKKSIEAYCPIEEADIVFVGEEKLLKEIAILKSVKTGGKFIVKLPGIKDEDLEKKLPRYLRNELKFRSIQLFLLDPTSAPAIEKDPAIETHST